MIDIEKAAKEILEEYHSGKHTEGIGHECFDRYITNEHIKMFQEGTCPFCDNELKDREIFHCSFGRGIIPGGSSAGYYQCTGKLLNGRNCSFGLGYVYVRGKKYLVPKREIMFKLGPLEFVSLINSLVRGDIKIDELKMREAMQWYFSDTSFRFGWIV